MADPATLAIGGAVLGGLAGGQEDVTTQQSRLLLGGPSELEQQAGGVVERRFEELGGLVDVGPGQQDVEFGVTAQRNLAQLLEQLAASGGLPSAAQQSTARSFAADIFAPERQAVTAGFAEQEQRTAQLAAQLGRPVSDPILQARLAQEQTRQLGGVGARQTAFAAQQAQNLPFQQLALTGQLAQVRGGLASQAFANRQALVGLGSQIQAGERQFRLGAAGRETTTTSGGGVSGAIGGALAGAGGALGIGGQLGILSTGTTQRPQSTGEGLFFGGGQFPGRTR